MTDRTGRVEADGKVVLVTGASRGIGLGLGYISPVSTLIKWFADRPGMGAGPRRRAMPGRLSSGGRPLPWRRPSPSGRAASSPCW